jgi:carbon storage regulator
MKGSAGQRPGRVSVLLQLPPDQAERLLGAVRRGELNDFEVLGARLVRPESPPRGANGRDMGHLVVTRQVGQSVVIGGRVTVTVVEARGGHVRLGIQAPRTVPVHRQEVQRAIQAESSCDP